LNVILWMPMEAKIPWRQLVKLGDEIIADGGK
jgi:hypothetical protein